MPRRKPRPIQGTGPSSSGPPAPPDTPPALAPAPEIATRFPAPAALPDHAGPVVPSARLTDALDEVMAESARRVAKADTPPAEPPKVESKWLAAALGSWLIVAALLLLRPAIARGPTDQPWRPPPGMTEASLRYGMWLARARVEGFTAAHGRLPSFIGEVGVTDAALTLVVTGERDYVIEGKADQTNLLMQRRMNADSFLGNSLVALRRQ